MKLDGGKNMINFIQRTSKIRLALLALVLIAAGFAAAETLRVRLVQAAPLSPATYTCAPDSVVSATVRVVAHCASGYAIPTTGPTIFWFAYPTSDSGNASRMLSLFETAKATGSTVTFYFETTDLSGINYGCQSNDCRAIWAATTP
jgi:hypothetical protein